MPNASPKAPTTSTSTSSGDVYSEPDYSKPYAVRKSNPLLVKVQTGKSRLATYDLPKSNPVTGEEHVYGKKEVADSEGVRDVVNSWSEHRPNADAQPSRDFVRSNAAAVSSGAVTNSQTMQQFRTTQQQQQQRAAAGATTVVSPKKSPSAAASAASATSPQSHSHPSHAEAATTHGRANRPSTPIQQLLTNSYQRQAIVESHAAQDAAHAQSVAKQIATVRAADQLNRHATTKASQGHSQNAPRGPNAAPMTEEEMADANERQAVKDFKMAKFKSVGAKVETHRHSATKKSSSTQNQSTASFATIHSPVKAATVSTSFGSAAAGAAKSTAPVVDSAVDPIRMSESEYESIVKSGGILDSTKTAAAQTQKVERQMQH